jgi:hypothetical protein
MEFPATCVMAGAIHVFLYLIKGVDARHKAGHDVEIPRTTVMAG